jgi:release factor family 2
MESTRPRPPGVIDATSVPQLARVFEETGPFVSVYLSTDPAIENAGQLSKARWKALRQDLLDGGAPEPAVEAVDALVPDAHREGATLVAVANAAGVQLVRHEPDPPARDVGRVGAVPSLGPVVEWAQEAVPHVVVLANRAGADLAGFTRSDGEVLVSAGSDDGHSPDLRRSAPGGWSQMRHQHRAENIWDERAKEVAEELVALVDYIDARLVVAAGDVRALQLLRENLPDRVDSLVQEVDGSRAADGGLDEMATDAVRLAATVAAEDTVGCLRRLREESGRQGLAVQGVEGTLGALAEARVDVLLLHDDPDDERLAWFGPEANLVASSRERLSDLGVAEPACGRLADVALRAALGTGAGVRMVPDTVPEGLAALLRY